MRRDAFFISSICVGLAFVGYMVLSVKGSQPESTKRDAAIARVTDPEAVLGTILGELEHKIDVKDGFILVTEPRSVETYLLPASSQWLVRCGTGASVQLGTGPIGSTQVVGRELEVELFDGPIDKAACAVVAPRVAMRMQEKLGK